MLLVKKFGGTSVGSLDRIKSVANIIEEYIKNGDQIIVVISAMSGVTDDILSKCVEMRLEYHKEYDQAIIVGEQISASLLAMALENLGYKARSYNCWNLPIYGNGEYGDGNIIEINSEQLKDDINNGMIPVITGFQAIRRDERRVITLGRGGSDYSAVMVAASVNADACYIYTDVAGVYNADPRIISDARKLNELSYDEIIEMADAGAKVLQLKSVIAAKKYKIYMKVLSTFKRDEEGTVIASNVLLNRDENIVTLNYKNFENNVKITALGLNRDLVLDIEQIGNFLIENEIEVVKIGQIRNNKIEIVVNLADRDKCLKLLNEFLNKIY